MIDDPVFRAQFGTGVPTGLNANKLPEEMKSLAAKVQKEIFSRLKGEAITLGIDGWTNARHR